jgi:hypothetical protein
MWPIKIKKSKIWRLTLLMERVEMDKYTSTLTCQYEKRLYMCHLVMPAVLRLTICMSQNIPTNFHIKDSLLNVIHERYCLALDPTVLSCIVLMCSVY